MFLVTLVAAISCSPSMSSANLLLATTGQATIIGARLSGLADLRGHLLALKVQQFKKIFWTCFSTAPYLLPDFDVRQTGSSW